jgi:rSAM/selenodomain-associated transferase 2
MAATLVSIIIPTLNEARALGATLDALADQPGPVELIVVDGGSLDRTTAVAHGRGVRVLFANRGRGQQLQAGARAAQGDVLWFVHADTHPPPGATALILRALARATVVGGNFAVQFDGPSRAARFMTWLYPRLRRLGLCYGDATLFVRRSNYRDVGGFRPYPLFEDVDLVGRLRRHGRFVHLPAIAQASSRRFEGRRFVLTFVWWVILQALYWLGVPPRMLGRLYAPIRSKPRKGNAWSAYLPR